MSFKNVGKVWSVESFEEYLKTVSNTQGFRAVTVHHTASPSLAQRPQGFTVQHIHNIKDFYQNERGWSTGPHLFSDENQIFGMCPLTEKGIHAASFNSFSVGIEMLGDYDSEDPKSGRGLQVLKTSARAVAALLKWMGKEADSDTLTFHRDDPKTSKTCPGTKVKKDWFLGLVEAAGGEVDTTPTPASRKREIVMALPDGSRVEGAWVRDGISYVPVYVLGAKFGMNQAQVKEKLETITSDHYDAEDEYTVAPIRDFAPLLPAPVTYSYSAGVLTIKRV